MARPSASQARQRRDTFARLLAHDYQHGGPHVVHANVVDHAKACRLDPWRAVRLLCDPRFTEDVYKLTRT